MGITFRASPSDDLGVQYESNPSSDDDILNLLFNETQVSGDSLVVRTTHQKYGVSVDIYFKGPIVQQAPELVKSIPVSEFVDQPLSLLPQVFGDLEVTEGYAVTNGVEIGKTISSDTPVPLKLWDPPKSDLNALSSFLAGDDLFYGYSMGDVAYGFAGNDQFWGNGGTDLFVGGVGTDTLHFDFPLSEWSRSQELVTNQSLGADQMGLKFVSDDNSQTIYAAEIERFKFSDQAISFDFMRGESGYDSVMLIGAAFGKDFVPAYFSAGLGLFDSGRDMAYVCDLIVGAGLIEAQIGDSTDSAWVKHVYKNVVGVEPDALTELVLIDFLASGQFTRSSLLAAAAELPLLEAQVDIAGLQTTGLAYTPFL